MSKQQPMWCPLCDCPSDECVQPEGEEQEDGDGPWMFVYWVDGHAAQWITLAERARDEALSNLEQTEITQPTQRNR